MKNIDSDLIGNLLILLAILSIAFGLGLNWERYTTQGGWIPILGYGAFLFLGAVYFLKQFKKQ